jgi:hypothetical protein
MVSIKDLFERGRAALVASGKETEAGKKGILRAGNTGIVALDGTIIGKCARLTYLRMKGITVEEHDANRELMFDGGRSNEDSWIEVLKAANEPGIIFLREEEIPISWTTSNGTLVTGRPDIVLVKEGVDANGSPVREPVKGIELKQVSSIWTARDVAFNLKPKMPHLLQAAHYSWQLKVPFELWYTSRTDFAIGSGWEQKQFPKDSAIIDYNPNGGAKKVLPFMQGFELGWNDKQQLMYRPVGSGDSAWKYTLITIDGIRQYYELVSTMETTDRLPPCPKNIEADGKVGGYSICDYCPLKSVCKGKSYGGLQEWLKAVAELTDKK